jgi:hypothetical protein
MALRSKRIAILFAECNVRHVQNLNALESGRMMPLRKEKLGRVLVSRKPDCAAPRIANLEAFHAG